MSKSKSKSKLSKSVEITISKSASIPSPKSKIFSMFKSRSLNSSPARVVFEQEGTNQSMSNYLENEIRRNISASKLKKSSSSGKTKKLKLLKCHVCSCVLEQKSFKIYEFQNKHSSKKKRHFLAIKCNCGFFSCSRKCHQEHYYHGSEDKTNCWETNFTEIDSRPIVYGTQICIEPYDIPLSWRDSRYIHPISVYPKIDK